MQLMKNDQPRRKLLIQEENSEKEATNNVIE